MLIYASLAAAAAIAAHGSQVPLTHFPEAGRPARRPSETFLGSPEFDGFIEEIMKNGSIPGVSLGVVRLGEDRQPIVQLGSWGRKTEDGEAPLPTTTTMAGFPRSLAMELPRRGPQS